MKSWSRNVKKWILFLKITGILVILCMIAGACILYAAENHIQLLKNNLSNEVWESGCEWVWQQIFPLSMDLTGKHSNQTLQTQKKWSSINTMDPAYDQYEKGNFTAPMNIWPGSGKMSQMRKQSGQPAKKHWISLKMPIRLQTRTALLLKFRISPRSIPCSS